MIEPHIRGVLLQLWLVTKTVINISTYSKEVR
jgi:hypothetical protein